MILRTTRSSGAAVTLPELSRRAIRRAAPAGVLALACLSAHAQQGDVDLASASLEDLTRLRVTVSSFARHSEDLWTTPAAVFVISSDEIAHSGATSIPDLLRMVPGLQIQQIDASTWAVTARGFDNQYANKLLVLVDGRTIYSEIFSGVQWDEIDLPLDEIDRIEVIRGPGAAVWGTNAVNGVINILTRHARSTIGTQTYAEASRIDENAGARYGATAGARADYRAFARFVNREPLENSDGSAAYDGESSYRAGGRLDFQRTAVDSISVTGDLYRGHVRQQDQPGVSLNINTDGEDPGWISGGYQLTRWEHRYAHSSTALQGYYQEQARYEFGALERTRTMDLDFQDQIVNSSRHDLVWGSELRLTGDHIAGPLRPTLLPEYKNYLIAGFLQDQITVVPNHLIATVGTKVQQGTLAGFQLQPSARLLWSPDNKQSFWAAVSRAAVAPAIQDRGAYIPIRAGEEDGLPVIATLEGNPDYKAETVVAYETGYRRELATAVTLDLAGFYNDNRRLTSLELVDPTVVVTPTPAIDVDFLYTNAYSARTAGVEGTLAWKPSSQLEVLTSYTWDQAHIHQVPAGQFAILDDWSIPRNEGSVSGWWNFAAGWALNGFFSYNGAISPSGGNALLSYSTPVSAYSRLDLHFSRTVGHFLALDAGGTDLLSPRHLESPTGANLVESSMVPRSLFLRGRVNF